EEIDEMRLYGIRVFVHDFEAARRFYRDTLGLKEKWAHGGNAAGFDLGADLIIEGGAADADAEDRALVGRVVGCSIEVEDIGATVSALTAKGVEFTGPPERQGWGGVLAHFKDPSGNVLTLLGR